MRYSSTDVYQHEMPGGQYTNLKFQAASLGLGDSWDKVQQSYAAANRCVLMGLCGEGVGRFAVRQQHRQTHTMSV